MADQPTDEQLKEAFQLYQNLFEGFWAHWKTVQKSTNNHRKLAAQTIIATLQMAATITVDIGGDPEVIKAKFDMLYQQAYARAPKFN